MRTIILITLLTVSTISCKEATKSNSTIETVNTESLTPSPIKHGSLNEEQLEKITFIQKTFHEVYPVSLDETIANFSRDQHPDNEITVWLNMARTYQYFSAKNAGEEKILARKEAFKLILMRSMMPEEQAIKSSTLVILDENQIQEILKNYALDAVPLKVENN